MRAFCLAVTLLVPILWLGGCAALPGVAAGVGGALLGRGLDAGSRGLDAADDYLVEGVTWRRELRVQMKEVVRQKCRSLKDDAALECWHGYYPTIEQLRSGIFGRPLESDNADE